MNRKGSRVKVRRTEVECIFTDTKSARSFSALDNKDAVKALVYELDEKRIAERPGKLVFQTDSDSATQTVEMECVFRWFCGNRIFVTYGNHEAVNMLMNKLVRKGMLRQPGRLIFEHTPGATTASFANYQEITGYICSCGHHAFAHFNEPYGRGRCKVEGCACREYKKRQKGALK